MSIELIDKIKPKNNGGFALIDAADVEMPDGTRLSEFNPGSGSGEPGKDGVSVTHSWDGTVLTITSASGTSSADLKGDPGEKGEQGEPGKDGQPGANGKDGYSPVKGTDYWTDADKQEIVAEAAGHIENLFVPITQDEYDALVTAGTVDETKYYMIVGDSA